MALLLKYRRSTKKSVPAFPSLSRRSNKGGKKFFRNLFLPAGFMLAIYAGAKHNRSIISDRTSKKDATQVEAMAMTAATVFEPPPSPLAIDCSVFLESSSSPENVVHVAQAEHPFDMSLHDPKLEIISRAIKEKGCFECPILNSLLSALKKLPQQASFIDIGGNIGMYSLYAASYGYNAVTFEPMKLNQERMCESIRLNTGFEDRVALIGAAMTDSSSTSKYVNFNTRGFKKYLVKRGDLNYGSGTVREIKSDNVPSGNRGVDYALSATVDSLQVTSHLPQPGSRIVLKVDVEGFECKAISGSLDYLSKVQIEYAAIELGYVRMQECHQTEGDPLAKIFDLFVSKGLEQYLFSNGKWIKVDHVNWIGWARKRSVGLFDTAWSKEMPTFNL